MDWSWVVLGVWILLMVGLWGWHDYYRIKICAVPVRRSLDGTLEKPSGDPVDEFLYQEMKDNSRLVDMLSLDENTEPGEISVRVENSDFEWDTYKFEVDGNLVELLRLVSLVDALTEGDIVESEDKKLVARLKSQKDDMIEKGYKIEMVVLAYPCSYIMIIADRFKWMSDKDTINAIVNARLHSAPIFAHPSALDETTKTIIVAEEELQGILVKWDEFVEGLSDDEV